MITKRLVLSIGGALLVFVAGGAGGYFLAVKQFKKILDEEPLDVKIENSISDENPLMDSEIINERPDKFDTPEIAVYNILAGGYRSPSSNKPVIPKGRTKYKGPYIIEETDYIDNPKDYAQVTLTYYEGDNTLVTAHDEVYQTIDADIGAGNMSELSDKNYHGNCMLVRNDELKIDFEIIKTPGSFATILGISNE